MDVQVVNEGARAVGLPTSGDRTRLNRPRDPAEPATPAMRHSAMGKGGKARQFGRWCGQRVRGFACAIPDRIVRFRLVVV